MIGTNRIEIEIFAFNNYLLSTFQAKYATNLDPIQNWSKLLEMDFFEFCTLIDSLMRYQVKVLIFLYDFRSESGMG